MNIHKNARLTAFGREHLVRAVLSGQTLEAAAQAAGVCPRTVHKWVARFKAEGVAGLTDRSSRRHQLYRPTSEAICEQVGNLRRQRWTGKRIALHLGLSAATVSRILQRMGLNRIRDLEPIEPPRRYEYDKPGGRIHIDIKKLGRFERIGHRITGKRTGNASSRGSSWEYVHVCIDDASRIAFSQIYPDQKKESAVGFLKAAVAYYESLGVTVTRVMTDNGSCYRSDARGLWIDRWDLNGSGALSNRIRIDDLDETIGRPDGAAADTKGYYWSAGVSAGRLNRFAPDGTLVDSIPLPVKAPTMPCFGGPHLDDLYVTSLVGQPDDPLSGMMIAARAEIAGTPVFRFDDV